MKELTLDEQIAEELSIPDDICAYKILINMYDSKNGWCRYLHECEERNCSGYPAGGCRGCHDYITLPELGLFYYKFRHMSKGEKK